MWGIRSRDFIGVGYGHLKSLHATASRRGVCMVVAVSDCHSMRSSHATYWGPGSFRGPHLLGAFVLYVPAALDARVFLLEACVFLLEARGF